MTEQPVIEVRDAASCRYDVVTLGEVMLRLDPGEGRVRSTRSFAVSEGGGEYNVGRALRRCFGHRVAHVTAIGDNEVGRLLEDLLLQGGVDLDHVVWKPADEVGRSNRNPLNFTERGFGVRSALGVYDRAHSATAGLEPDDIDWEHLFGDLGVRWFHTGGIFAGLSPSTLATTRAAMAAARRYGTIVSYDVNYRPSLWAAAGGPDAARELTARLLDDVDVLFGVDANDFEATVRELSAQHPNLAMIAVPRRIAVSATKNFWSGQAWTPACGVVAGMAFDELEILDRVGGGDGFAAGVIHGVLNSVPAPDSLALGIAHGALVMTTAGDTSGVSAAEVAALASGADRGARR